MLRVIEAGGSRVKVAVGGMRVAEMAVAVVVGASVGASIAVDGTVGVAVLVAGPVVQETSQTASRIMPTTGGLLVVRFFMGCLPNNNAPAQGKGGRVSYPWSESNARLRLRRPPLYPLSYRGTRR